MCDGSRIRTQVLRASVVSSQVSAHDGMPLTALYEHMMPEAAAPWGLMHASNATRYVSARSCCDTMASKW